MSSLILLWVKFSADDILKYFPYFSQKTGFDILCKLSPMETICIKCKILLSGKEKKNLLWVKFSADDILKYFPYFSQKTGFDISCKLSPMETICIKCKILLSGKKKKNITNLLSAENAQRVVKVKQLGICSTCICILYLSRLFFLFQCAIFFFYSCLSKYKFEAGV